MPRRSAPSLPSGAEGRPDVSGVLRAERQAWRGAEGQRGAQQVRRGAADARVGDGPAARGRTIPFRLSVRRENGNVSLPPSLSMTRLQTEVCFYFSLFPNSFYSTLRTPYRLMITCLVNE